MSWMTTTKWGLPIGDRTIPSQSDYIHSLFFAHFIVQVVNALLQHLIHTPIYIVYITILHGPILLLIVTINQLAHNYVAKHVITTAKTELTISILWPLGGLTKHHTKNISDDVHLALTGPAIHVAQCIFWFLLYLIFSGGRIEEAITQGAIYEQLHTFGGLLKNVFAQAFWLNVVLFCTHLFLPAYPSDASSLLAGALSFIGNPTSKTLAFLTDCAGAVVSALIVLVGIYQTLFDDNNGIGIFLFMNYFMLLASCLRRVFDVYVNSEGVTDHPLVGRPCYQEIEATDDHDQANTSDSLELTETNENGNMEVRGTTDKEEDNFVV